MVATITPRNNNGGHPNGKANMEIGRINRARVDAVMPQGFYLELETGGRVLLPGNKNQFTLEEGEIIDVFVYMDSEDRPIATLDKPFAQAGEFAVLTVKDVNRVGAFLDWGLNKDLFLPYKQQLGELVEGDRCVVYILVDEKSGRLVATEKIKTFIDYDTEDLHAGQRVELAAYEVTREYVDFLVDYRYTGRLMLTPGMQRIYIGDTMPGFIQRITNDGKITLNLTPVGYKGVINSDAPSAILNKLTEAGGFLPYGDHTDPETIRQEFSISKKTFKKIIGGLFRDGKIVIAEDGIRSI
ncbi:S1-like domain-containing RNA-binding protein [Fibrobacter sp.]|uniref:CvfB family protein n=1 Tax=Fibrobacter sp. TaxID=35828 RepID=UPI0025BB53DE|nr:S1-like domain-containing RNA-binding protein [Fibrobacter sp.]